MKLIYRKADRLVVGSITPPQSEVQELTNICRSELGGVSDDYACTEVVSDKRSDQDYRVDPTGIVTLVPNPMVVQREADLLAAKAKLSVLGLSAAEIQALVG